MPKETIKEKILEIIFPTPKICPICGKIQHKLEICRECIQIKNQVAKDIGQCTRCGTFSHHGVYCPNCYGWPKGYVKNTTIFPYQESYEEFIRKFKFGYHGYLAKPAAMGLFNEICRNPSLAMDMAGSLIIPVPMSPKRKRQKGYNQAEILALEVGKVMAEKMRSDILLRPQDTRHQVGLSSKLRRKNLNNAFKIPRDRVKDIIGQNILLVDDVLTTSATLTECATMLLSQGASKIYSVTIATGNPVEREDDHIKWK